MSLKFVFGPSGSGKSYQLYDFGKAEGTDRGEDAESEIH